MRCPSVMISWARSRARCSLFSIRSAAGRCRSGSAHPDEDDAGDRNHVREFEDYLTDYLDGFLVAPLYHRWERHAALCESCSDCPAMSSDPSVLAIPTNKMNWRCRRIGSSDSAKHHRNVLPQQVRAPFMSRLVEWLRGALDQSFRRNWRRSQRCCSSQCSY